MTYLEALDYAKSRKVVLPAEYYNDLSAAQRSRATTIAGMASLDQIKAVIDLVNEALATGKTFKQFQDSVDQLFGKGKLGLPKGRLDNIFRTNIQVAYAQGRYQQQKRNASNRPYLLYSAVNDSRTRPSHLAKNGTVLHRDHPWWLTNTPPCGYRCRCTVISLTQAQAEKRGISAAPPEAVSDEGWDFHPSEYDGVLAKAEAKKLEALEVKTKQASAQISGFVSSKEDVSKALNLLETVRSAVNIGTAEEVSKQRSHQFKLMKYFRLETGLELPIADAALAAGYTYDGYKALSNIKIVGFLSAAEELAFKNIDYAFKDLQKVFPNKSDALWRGLPLNAKGLEKLKTFTEGKVLEWISITSATTEEVIANLFAVAKEDSVAKVRFELLGMSGVGLDVLASGLRDDEAEVILLRGSKVRVLDVRIGMEDGLPIYYIKAKSAPVETPSDGKFSVISNYVS